MNWVTIPAAMVGLLILYIGLPTALKPLIRKGFLRRVRASGCVCLTFDDGPNPASTPQILEALRAYEARATFFILGSNARRYPEMVRAIRDEGHEVAEHGFGHSMPWYMGPVRTILDISRCARVLERAGTASAAAIYRPPYGKLNLASLLFVYLSGRRFAFWDVDPRDYAQTSAEALVTIIRPSLRPGTVILLHDGRRKNTQAAQVTAEALPLLLATIRERGLHLSTIGEALDTGDPVKRRYPRSSHRISQP